MSAKHRQPVDPKVVDLYNDYIHGDMPRRAFLKRVVEIGGSAAAATTMIALVEPDWAWGQQVDPGDERLQGGYVEYPGATGPVKGYLARPADR